MSITPISVVQAQLLLAKENLVVVDIRDADSYHQSHLPGAERLSSSNMSSFINGLSTEQPILVYCYRGVASRFTAQWFIDMGMQQVYTLEGGFAAWQCRNEVSQAV